MRDNSAKLSALVVACGARAIAVRPLVDCP